MSFSAFVRTHNPLPSSTVTRVPKKKAGVFQVGDKIKVIANPKDSIAVREIMNQTFRITYIDGEKLMIDSVCNWLLADEVEHV